MAVSVAKASDRPKSRAWTGPASTSPRAVCLAPFGLFQHRASGQRGLLLATDALRPMRLQQRSCMQHFQKKIRRRSAKFRHISSHLHILSLVCENGTPVESCWSIDTNLRRAAIVPLQQRPFPDLTSMLQGSLTPAIRGLPPALARVRIEVPWTPHEAGSRRRLQRIRVAVCGCGRTSRPDHARRLVLPSKDPMPPERSTTIVRRTGAAGCLSILPC